MVIKASKIAGKCPILLHRVAGLTSLYVIVHHLEAISERIFVERLLDVDILNEKVCVRQFPKKSLLPRNLCYPSSL